MNYWNQYEMVEHRSRVKSDRKSFITATETDF